MGTSGSGAILANLERSNLFTSVDSTGEWYQLHHLFAEALSLELARTRPELVRPLHLRAAQWFEDNGDLETATAHAIASHDLALATRLVAVQAQSLTVNGRWVTVRGWLSELSRPEAQADPEPPSPAPSKRPTTATWTSPSGGWTWQPRAPPT